MKIPLIKPYMDNEIKNKVLKVLDSGILTEGLVTKEFENKFSEYIGCKYSIAVTSCTTGLELALRALKIKAGDEVIVPDFTYPATAAVAPILGAKSVLVDINRNTMLIDYDKIENAITSKTKAIIPVSGFGNPLDYEKLNKIKEKYNVFIVEDAACSVGAEYKNIKVGNWADISVFSFHPRKFITTGEGGMITTNNEKWSNWMNSYKHFGMNMNNSLREGIKFDIIGTNYKLSNILSAIGLAQLNIVVTLLNKRIELVENYKKLLANYDKVVIPDTTKHGKHSYQSFCIFVNERDRIMKSMRDIDIEVQIGTYSLHQHNAFSKNKLVHLSEEYNNSIFAFEHCLTLPLYNELTYDSQKKIITNLMRLIENN